MAGVYLLLGPRPQADMLRLYIGEGDPIGPRLESHYAKRDFWTTALFFVSPDRKLNKAHIQYLEARLVEIADAAKRCELENVNIPSPPSLSEMDGSEAEGFLQEILLCLPLMGVTAFEEPARQASVGKTLYIRAKGLEARGYESSEGFVVLEKSQVALDSVPSCVGFVKELRDKLTKLQLLQQQEGHLILSKNYVFNSPSTAPGVILGMTSNGREKWKDSQGRSLKELQEQSVPA